MTNRYLGIGLYTSLEASRLLQTSAQKISYWLGGYSYKDEDGESHWVDSLWTPDLEPDSHDQVLLSFRDLMEVRFVEAFRKANLPLQKIRFFYKQAQSLVQDDRPLSSAKFRTDGKKIFQIFLNKDRHEVIDLTDFQHAFQKVIEPSFKDIEFGDGRPLRWRPSSHKSIVLDPERSFGQPIVEKFGIPTATLFAAYNAEPSVAQISRYYELPSSAVQSAIRFEKHLAGI